MSATHPGEITVLLAAARQGSKEAEEQVAALLLPDLESFLVSVLASDFAFCAILTVVDA